jgi:hypothetical protein
MYWRATRRLSAVGVVSIISLMIIQTLIPLLTDLDGIEQDVDWYLLSII